MVIPGKSHWYRGIEDAKRVEFLNRVRPHHGIEQQIPEEIQQEEKKTKKER